MRSVLQSGCLSRTGMQEEFSLFVGRDNKHTSQSASYSSLSEPTAGPRKRVKQICVGCQLFSLLKDKDNIQGMCSQGPLDQDQDVS